LIKNYDSFLDTLGVFSLVDTPIDRELAVELPLFTTDADTKRLFDLQEAPLNTYLSMNDEIL
jgi:hypothetical protein